MSRFTGTFNPASSFAHQNAMIRVHDDTPAFVQRKFDDAGIRELRFQSLENVNESQQPNFEQISIVGRSENYISYSGSSNRVITLDLHFVASVNQFDQGDFDIPTRNIRFLQALTLPTYGNGGVMYPPPLCLLVLGRFIAARGVLSNMSPQYTGTFSGRNHAFEYPLHVTCSMEFTCVNTQPLQASDYLRAAAEGGDMEPSLRSIR